MTITTDKFGRLVLPKKFRDAMGADPGVPLEAKLEGTRVIIERKREMPLLRRKNGILIYTGPWPKGVDIIQQQREERIKHILGLDK
ncbi:MAG: AbrB/MazE/SpoVT family DNA-binding domain-containing protein [Phycisphaerae bacterium]